MDDDGDLEGGEATTKNVFSNYFCSVKKGSSHPGDIAEAASLGAVKLPSTSYPLWDALPEDLVGSGKLSCLQLEGILHACTMHQKLLPGTGERAGFFIGDGAGVGKGRQIAGTIIDNYVRGRRKHVWVSISTDLHLDATRDFRDLGCHINIINNCQSLDKETRTFGLSKDYQEGVLFMTYSTLTSCSKGRSRIEQVIDWVGGASWSGVLVFDECHKAKNFAKDTGGTKMAAAVIELQQRLPQARVLYCSATGVSEVGNMAYMSRMGLWGPGTAFQDFEAFLDSMKKRGVSFMELLAMEMKAEGKYVARGLSFKDAEFMEVEAPLEKGQAAIYDDAVKLWKQLRRMLEYAEPMMPPVSSSTTAPSSAAGGGVSAGTAGTAAGGASSGGSSSKDVWRAYWAVQQRFFKLLCVSMKVLLVVSEAKEALAKGQSVVIGLQSTGEAAADAMNLSPGEVLPAFVSPTKEMLHRFVDVHFPTVVHHVEDGNPDLDGGDSSVAGSREVPELVQMKEELHEAIEAMQLPPNFLDHIIDELGGPAQVAEMTGRKGRVIRGSGGKLTYELRARPETADMDSLNVRERDAFMSGRKLVAIISDAASTGISLHASHTVKNQRRRIHMTVELPWSADKAIQQLGRTHRSNQVTGPIYKLISTRVGGEKRFAAAVARRLQSMGALTRGDRRAASGVDLSASNMDTPLGRKSLRRMYDAIVLESESLPPGVKLEDVYCDHPDAELFKCDDASLTVRHIARLHVQLREYCDLMGVGLSTNGKSKDTVVDDNSSSGRKSGGDGKDVGDVRRFLNRILGLPLLEQNLLFSYFSATLTTEIKAAKTEGKYSEGLSDLVGRSVKLVTTQAFWHDSTNSSLSTKANVFSLDRGISYQEAVRRLQHEGDDILKLSGFRRAKRPVHAGAAVMLAIHKAAGGTAGGGGRPGATGAFTIIRPNTGVGLDMDRDDLEARYLRMTPEDVEEEWTQAYELALKHCIHGPECSQGSGCTIGRRLTRVTVLTGSVVRIWGTLEAVLLKHEHQLSRVDKAMRVVRVEMDGRGAAAAGVHQPSRDHASAVHSAAATASLDEHAAVITNSGHLVGVRFPGQLLKEVVTMLSSIKIQQNLLHMQKTMLLGPTLTNSHITSAATKSSAAGSKSSKSTTGLLKGISSPSMSEVMLNGAAGIMAASTAAGGALLPGVCEEPTPVDISSQLKAFKAPKTISDFFKKVAHPTSMNASQQQKQQHTAAAAAAAAAVGSSVMISSGIISTTNLNPMSTSKYVQQRAQIDEDRVLRVRKRGTQHKRLGSVTNTGLQSEPQALCVTILSDEDEEEYDQCKKGQAIEGQHRTDLSHCSTINNAKGHDNGNTNNGGKRLRSIDKNAVDQAVSPAGDCGQDEDEDEDLEVMSGDEREGAETRHDEESERMVVNSEDEGRKKARKINEEQEASTFEIANEAARLDGGSHAEAVDVVCDKPSIVRIQSHVQSSAADALLRNGMKAVGPSGAYHGTMTTIRNGASTLPEPLHSAAYPPTHFVSLHSRPALPGSSLPGISLPRLPKREALQLMCDLGFTGKQAEVALFMAHGDVNKAAELCISGSVKT